MKKIFVLIILLILLGGITILVLSKNQAGQENLWIQVQGNSMYPTLGNGNLYKAVKVNSWKELQNQDIVVFKLYNSPNYFVKRLWIKPNDKFTMNYSGDVLYIIINEKNVLKLKNYKDSSFYKMLKIWSKGKSTGIVKNTQCAVLGDNQSSSQDSLKFGFISCYRIKYKLLNCKPNTNER